LICLRVQQLAEAEAVHAAIVRRDGEVLHAAATSASISKLRNAAKAEAGIDAGIGPAEGLAVKIHMQRQVDDAVFPGVTQFVRRDGNRREGARRLGLEEAETLGEFAGDQPAQRHVIAQHDELDVGRRLRLGDAHRHVIGDDGDLPFHVTAPGDIAQRDGIAGAEEGVTAALIHQRIVIETFRHFSAPRFAHQFDVIDIGRSIRPLIGARQWAFAIMLVETEGGYAAQLHLLSQKLEARGHMFPVVQRRLQGRGNRRGIRGARQVFRNDNETPVSGTVFKSREFHSGSPVGIRKKSVLGASELAKPISGMPSSLRSPTSRS
jgi:hypothetical protein